MFYNLIEWFGHCIFRQDKFHNLMCEQFDATVVKAKSRSTTSAVDASSSVDARPASVWSREKSSDI